MANTINSVSSVGTVIAKAAAKMLADKVQFVKAIDKEDSFNEQVNGYEVGQTITINKPARFNTNNTADITSAISNVTEEKTTLTLANQTNIGVNLSSLEIATQMGLKSWAKRILEPAMSSLAQNIESQALTAAVNATYNTAGTAGSTVFDTDTMLSVGEKQALNLAPMDDKNYALLNPTAMRSATNARKGLFQSSEEIAKQYKLGYIGQSDGFTYLRNSLLPTHTRGTAATTGTVTTTSTEGASTIALTGTGSQTLLVGDVFTVAGVFAVHPITKTPYTYLQQFVVTANNTASSGAYTGVAISPSIYAASAGLQNVSALPQSGAAFTLIGSASTGYVQNLAFHKSAYRFASKPLFLPKKAEMAAIETVDGMSVRVWQDTAILTDKMILRIDCLWGITAVRPEWGCRITA